MDTTATSVDKHHYPFPRAVFIILLVEFGEKFCHYASRGVLPFFFVEKLQFNEDEATVTFHTLQVILYVSSLIGGIVADSFFGKYKTLVYSNVLIGTGLIILSITVIPPLRMPIVELTFLALIMVQIGFGATAPCILSFGGDQFILPQQQKQMSLFFMLILLTINVGSVLAFFISPILRKDVRCFGDLGCYPLVFGVPASIIIITLVAFILTKKRYTIQQPRGNITVKIIGCIWYSLSRKAKTKEKKKHWLDYASDKYDVQFIQDVKSTFQIFTLYLPVIIYTALYAAESTTMTFQASRMNGEVGNYMIKPDQIHFVQPLFAIIVLPLLHYYVYPFMAKYLRLDTPLKKITLSLSFVALSYYSSTIVELNLERTYAPKLTNGISHLRIYNTVDCRAVMTIDEQKITIDRLAMWENLSVPVTGKRMFDYSVDFEGCSEQHLSANLISGSFEVSEKQANSLALTEDGLSYKFLDSNNKSRSGNPLVRAVIHTDADVSENDFTLKIALGKEAIGSIAILKNATSSEFVEVVHGRYDLYLNDQRIQSDVSLRHGGVYAVVGHIVANSSQMASRTVIVTPPNSMHILWVLPQELLFCTGLIIIEPTGMAFMYSQAPMSMKAFMEAYWIFLSALGHLLVILVTDLNTFDRKVFVFLTYAVMMTVGAIVFALLAKAYKTQEPQTIQANAKKNEEMMEAPAKNNQQQRDRRCVSHDSTRL